MKKVLIATTNHDKFNAVKKIFEATIFKKDEYQLDSLSAIPKELIETKEEGDNLKRAKRKALDAYEQFKEYNYDYIVGLDDAIYIKGVLDPNIKMVLKKVLYENYLDEGEEYGFDRAYCFIDASGREYETHALIPYIYRSCKDAKIEDFSYPLSAVAYPIGYDKPISSLSSEDEVAYYLKYVKDALESLGIK